MLRSLRDLTVLHAGSSEPALRDFSATFREGAVTGIVGPNGAGKSSLAFVLAGLLPRLLGGAWKGEVDCRGVLLQPTGWPPPVIAAYTSQDQTGHVILGVLGDILSGLSPDLAALARELPLPDPRTEVKHLSTGQRHAIDWILCQSRRPTIMILDEGLSSMDSVTAKILMTLSRGLQGHDGRFLLLIDQDRHRLSSHADGIVSLSGSPQASVEAPRVPWPREVGFARLQADHSPVVATISAWWPDNPETVFSLDDIQIAPGNCLLVRGRIGAGKSTLLKAVSGYPGPRGGKGARLVGRTFNPLYFGVTDHFVAADPTIERSLARVYGPSGVQPVWERLAPLLEGKALSTDPGTLSFGQRRLIALIAVFGSAQRALALDEPDKGLDLRAQSVLIALIAAFTEAGGTIFLASHNDAFIEHLRRVVPHLKLALISERRRT